MKSFELEAEKAKLRFRKWPDFEDEFRKDFTPLNEEAKAVNILETSAYHQGRKSVDDYLDRFRCQASFMFWVKFSLNPQEYFI